jgi:hypothetical protein
MEFCEAGGILCNAAKNCFVVETPKQIAAARTKDGGSDDKASGGLVRRAWFSSRYDIEVHVAVDIAILNAFSHIN